MQQDKPGDRIGGEYTVLKVFGGENQSGMGVVYLVQDRELPTNGAGTARPRGCQHDHDQVAT